MTYLYELPNATSGMDTILVSTMTSFPFLAPLLLLFVWFVIFLGGITRERLRTGDADTSAWAVLASMATLIISLAMTLIPGMIRLDWLVIVVVITIFSGVMYFLKNKGSDI